MVRWWLTLWLLLQQPRVLLRHMGGVYRHTRPRLIRLQTDLFVCHTLVLLT